jgi:ribosomal protein S12 methylthiotransferase
VAQKRRQQVEETQLAITAAALQTRVGSVRHVLVEERIDGEDLAIGRADLNAPEVDGAIVVVGGNLKAGDRLDVRITAVRGVDLEAVPMTAPQPLAAEPR